MIAALENEYKNDGSSLKENVRRENKKKKISFMIQYKDHFMLYQTFT